MEYPVLKNQLHFNLYFKLNNRYSIQNSCIVWCVYKGNFSSLVQLALISFSFCPFIAFRVGACSSSSGNSRVDLLHIDWGASVFADWRCAALSPLYLVFGWEVDYVCLLAGLSFWYVLSRWHECWFSEHWYFHGAETAGKVAASFSFLAGIGFCGLPLLSDFFT